MKTYIYKENPVRSIFSHSGDESCSNGKLISSESRFDAIMTRSVSGTLSEMCEGTVRETNPSKAETLKREFNDDWLIHLACLYVFYSKEAILLF